MIAPYPTVITVYWSKGGVGKSTLVQLLALVLAGIGKRVVIVDLDAQGGQTAMWDLFDPETGLGYETLFMVLRTELSALDALHYVDPAQLPRFKGYTPGSVAVIEGGPQTPIALADIQAQPVRYKTRSNQVFNKLVAQLAGEADVVLFDMGPSNQTTALAALNATDYLLMPTLMDRSSVERAAAVLDEVYVAQEDNPDLKVLGIIGMMTMYYFGGLRTSPNVKAGREMLETVYSEYALRDAKGDLLELPYSEDYTRARWVGTNILAGGNLRPATLTALAVIRDVLSRTGLMIPEVHYA